jgi:integrase
VNGSKRQELLGRFPEMKIEQARAAANERNAAFGQGKNPLDEASARKAEPTFRDLFEIYLDRHARKTRKTTEEMIKNFERWLAPLAKRKPSSISRADAEKLHKQLSTDRGIYAANRAIQLARAIFNKCKLFNVYSGDNPFAGITLFPEKSRDRFLSDEEAVRLINALMKSHETDLRDFILLDLMTGVRKSNLLAMRWEDIDFNAAVWIIPDTKNGTAQVVPLGDNELTILQVRHDLFSSGLWVFPTSKRSKSGHIEDLKKSWTTVRKQAGIKDITIHDLRRSLGAAMASQNINVSLIKSALHHKDLKTTVNVYARTANQAVLAAKQKVQNNWFDKAKVERDKVASLPTDEAIN